jgi:hypothetical protein
VRIFVGFDDTDVVGADRGTGKLARWFEESLPESCRVWGVLRQQLLVRQCIPYTSHNSAACVVVDAPPETDLPGIVERAANHIETWALPGSDPGICVAAETAPTLPRLTEFGMACTRRAVTQKEAMRAAERVHLSGHGGTNGGIIGAAAGVGLTAAGWHGRFIEFGPLRSFSDRVRVSDLLARNIQVLSIDRDGRIPSPGDHILTRQWVRPRLIGGAPVLLVRPSGEGVWENIGRKRRKAGSQDDPPPRPETPQPASAFPL